MSELPIQYASSMDVSISDTASRTWLTVDLEHRFQRQQDGFHLQLAFEAQAARTVIFGPSGSGKSSLLRAIAGLFEPNAGHIQIHGKTVWRRTLGKSSSSLIPAEKRRVGLVLQSPSLFPHLTVARNVAFAMRGMAKPLQKEKVLRLLQLVEAESLVNHWPRELSGGQLQRVAIARALAAGPTVLLLDEPFAALDTRSRQQLSANIHDWARTHQVPILMVTHNLEEAFSAGDEIVVMHDGHITAQGKPHTVLMQERDRLLESLGVNFTPYSPET